MATALINPLGDWDSLDARQEAERAAWGAAELKTLNANYDQLGDLGAQFKAACNNAACAERFDFDWISNTRAVTNTFHTSKGFMNEIVYGKTVISDKNTLALFAARTHEHTHLAFQFAKVAGAHATPFNVGARVVLCPRDAMVLNILMERQAFAAELIFEDLLRDVWSGKRSLASGLSAAEVQPLLRGYVLNLSPRTRWSEDAKFQAHYRDQILTRYEGPDRIDHMKNSHVVYARLGIADLKAFNDFLGMKVFADDDAGLASFLTMPLTPDQQARLNILNAKLGIWYEDTLPLLSDALYALGTSPERFVDDSRGNRLGTPLYVSTGP